MNSNQSQLLSPEVIWKASKENVISGKGNQKLSGHIGNLTANELKKANQSKY